MPFASLKDERVRELTALAQRYGGILADEAYGPEGPGLDVDLTTMEDLAVRMQRALLQGMCEQLTRKQAGHLPHTVPCPGCGRECEVEPPRPPDCGEKEEGSTRPMQTRGGAFELAEPRCHCRSCRRSFFPSADRAAD